MADAEKKQEDWMSAKWRPAMGWVYMVTCTTDFIIFPILWSLLQAALKQPVTAWQPITLQGAGLYHLAMGAIIGVAAFGRTQEKLAGANNGGLSNTPSASMMPAASMDTSEDTIVPPLTLKIIPSYTFNLFCVVSNQSWPTMGVLG